jgi:hypothetical protein
VDKRYHFGFALFRVVKGMFCVDVHLAKIVRNDESVVFATRVKNGRRSVMSVGCSCCDTPTT